MQAINADRLMAAVDAASPLRTHLPRFVQIQIMQIGQTACGHATLPRHGRIRALDREALEALAASSDGLPEAEYDRLIPSGPNPERSTGVRRMPSHQLPATGQGRAVAAVET